jgi:hypothetical protein
MLSVLDLIQMHELRATPLASVILLGRRGYL